MQNRKDQKDDKTKWREKKDLGRTKTEKTLFPKFLAYIKVKFFYYHFLPFEVLFIEIIFREIYAYNYIFWLQ